MANVLGITITKLADLETGRRQATPTEARLLQLIIQNPSAIYSAVGIAASPTKIQRKTRKPKTRKARNDTQGQVRQNHRFDDRDSLTKDMVTSPGYV